MKTIGVIVIALAMLIALTGMVMADQVVPAVPEVQGITTSTVISCEGTVMDSASLGWSLTDGAALATRGLHPNWSYMLDPMQIQYSTTYDASTIAQSGQTVFVNSRGISTSDKLLTQSNVKSTTEATYLATGDGGNILGSENIMIDGAGMPTPASDRMLCPFGAGAGNVIPAYCNIVQAGSQYNLNVGSIVQKADDMFVGTDATVPVVLNYAITVKPYTVAGQGTSPAMGSVSAYIKAAIKEGRSGYIDNSTGLNTPIPATTGVWQPYTSASIMNIGNNTYPTGPAETLNYAESSSASGIINSFSKTMSYQSGKVLV